jgi:hypothetical protein
VAELRAIGWREVLVVAVVAVAVVLLIDVVTSVVPALKDVVTRTPLLIGLMVLATAWLLWRIARPRPPGPLDGPPSPPGD